MVGQMFASEEKYSSPKFINQINLHNNLNAELIDQNFIRKYEKLYNLSIEKESFAILLIPVNGSKRTFGTIRIIFVQTIEIVKDNNFEINKYLKSLVSISDLLAHRISTLRLKTQTDSILEINKIIHKQLDEEESIQLVVDNVINNANSYSFCLVHKFEKDKLRLISSSTKISKDLSFKVGEGTIGKVFLNSEIEKISNIKETTADLKYSDWINEEGIEAMICYPINSNDSSIKYGTITILLKFPYKFEDYDLKYLEDYSGQISNLIQSIIDRRNNDFIKQLSLKIISESRITDIYRDVINFFNRVDEYIYCAIVRNINDKNKIVNSNLDSLMNFSIPNNLNFLNSISNEPDIVIFNEPSIITSFTEFNKLYPQVKSIVIVPFLTNTKRINGALVVMRSTEIENSESYIQSIKNNNLYQIQTLVYTIANLVITSERKELNKTINDIVQKIEEEQNFQSSMEIILRETLNAVNAQIGYITILENGATYIKPKYALIKNNNEYIELGEDKFNKEFVIGKTGISGYIFTSENPEPYLFPSNPQIDSLYIDYYDLEENNIKNEVICPLTYVYKHGDQSKADIVGFISFASFYANSFTIEHLKFINSIAQQTINILINHHIQKITLELAQTKFTELNTKTICNTIARSANSIMKTNISCVWLVDRSREYRVLKMISSDILIKGCEIDYADFDMKEDEGLTWRLLKDNNLSHNVTKNLSNNTEYFHPEFIEKYGLATMLTVPIKVGDEILGAINIYSQRDVNFHGSEINLFRSLADRGAFALRNIELTEEIEQIFNIATPLCEIDIEYNIIRVNKTFTTLFGVNESEVINKKCHELAKCPNYDSKKCAVKSLYNDQKKDFHEEIERSYNNEKTTIPCILTASKRTNINGKATFVENYIDITRRKILEKEYKEQQEKLRDIHKFRALTDNYFELKHQLNQPLQGISGFNVNIKELTLKNPYANRSEILKNTGLITDSIKRIKHLTDKFHKIYSALHNMKPQMGNMHTLIGKVRDHFDMKCRKENIKITTDLKANRNKIIFCEIGLIKECFHNFINNSINAIIQANNTKGKITICSYDKAEFLIVEIFDNGIGIHEEMIDKIWQPYFSVESKNTAQQGLGLFINKNILDAHFSTIITESKHGEYTKFIIQIDTNKLNNRYGTNN
ncbi:MAG: GAF domain-containing protein [Melioribacteraceae bacterium]